MAHDLLYRDAASALIPSVETGWDGPGPKTADFLKYERGSTASWHAFWSGEMNAIPVF